MDTGEIVSIVEDLAATRLGNRPPPVYVMGFVVSASRWPAAMIAEALSLVDVGEALIPSELVAGLEPDPREQGLAVDCLHLTHALALHPEAAPAEMLGAQMVGSGVPTVEPRHRVWDPECSAIHILRDPRDRVTDLAFCRRSVRDEFFPTISDDLFLSICASRIARELNDIRRSPVKPDFVCPQVALETSAAKTLVQLAAALGRPIDEGRAIRTARAHEVSSADGGHASTKALPPCRGWRAETSEPQKAMLHSWLTEVVSSVGYAADDCLGKPLDLEAPHGERRPRFGEEDSLGVLFTRRISPSCGEPWTRHANACGEVVVPGDLALKLRVTDSAPRDAIASLAGLAPDDLESLCLAGNPTIDDELLGPVLASLGGIQELDLARTAVTHAVLPMLERLPRLRGLNVSETALGPGDIFDLRAALGPAAALASTPLPVERAVERRRQRRTGVARRSPLAPRALVTGCPRSGTDYLANVLGWAGVASGHEAVYGPNGVGSWDCVSVEVSWLAAPFLPVDGAPAAHQVRDPLAVVRSLVGIRFFEGGGEFLRFAEEACPRLREESTPESAAVRMWCEWTRMAEAHAVDRWRVEEVASEAERIAAHAGAPLDRLRHTIEHAPRDINQRRRAPDLDLGSVPHELWAEFEAIAVDLGYEVSR